MGSKIGESMYTIYKYKLRTTDVQAVQMHSGARILSVGLDPSGALCLWAMVHTSQPQEQRAVFILGTGNPIDSEGEDSLFIRICNCQYIGTVRDGSFIWHIWVD